MELSAVEVNREDWVVSRKRRCRRIFWGLLRECHLDQQFVARAARKYSGVCTVVAPRRAHRSASLWWRNDSKSSRKRKTFFSQRRSRHCCGFLIGRRTSFAVPWLMSLNEKKWGSTRSTAGAGSLFPYKTLSRPMYASIFGLA